jgi:hypothetical protein
MKNYEDRRIGRLAEQLEKAGINPGIIDRIMDGGEDMKHGKSVKKADWFRDAMLKMDELIDFDTRKAIRENCACHIGGPPAKFCEEIAKNNKTIEARIKAANEAHKIFGHSVKMENGEIIVQCFPDGLEKYRCACLPQADKPLPESYCYCCGGNLKFNLQLALGRKLECMLRSSVLTSGNKKSCIFSYKIIE